MLRVLATLAVATAGLSAQSAVSITSSCLGNVVYTFNSASIPSANTGVGGSANLRATGAAGQDQLFDNWWYYRINADTREFSFSRSATSGLQNPAAPIVTGPKGDSAVIEWINVDGKSFNARLTTTVYSTSATSGVASQCMEIVNRTGATMTLNLFNCADYDVCATAGTDSAAFAGPPQQIVVTDPACNIRALHLGCRSTNYLTAPFGATSARTLMGNAVVDNLSNTGIPFGPGDWTNGYQWQDIQIPDGQSARFYVALAIDRLVPCCDPADVQHYCTGKPGTNGIPRLGHNPLFVGGQTELKVLNGLPGSPPIVAIGVPPQVCLPIPGIGNLAVSPILATFIMPPFNAAGVSAVCLNVPDNPGLCGAALTIQAFFADPGAAGGIAHTEGGEFRIGGV